MSPGYWCRKTALIPYGCAPPASVFAYLVQLLSGNDPTDWKPDVATPHRKFLGNLVWKPLAAFAGATPAWAAPPHASTRRMASRIRVRHIRPTGSLPFRCDPDLSTLPPAG